MAVFATMGNRKSRRIAESVGILEKAVVFVNHRVELG
jgi:hypothetical protein